MKIRDVLDILSSSEIILEVDVIVGSSLFRVGGFKGSLILWLGRYNVMTAGIWDYHEMCRYLPTLRNHGSEASVKGSG